jgi:hypothetical protein
MKSKIVGIVAGIGSAIAIVPMAFATPTYTMDTTLQTGFSTLLTDLVSGGYGIILAALAIGGGFYVSMILLRMLIGWFKKLFHH